MQHAARRDAVDVDGARAAHAVLAADVRAGESEVVAEEVRQQQTRLDRIALRAAVDGDLDLDHVALSIARVVSTPVSCAEVPRSGVHGPGWIDEPRRQRSRRRRAALGPGRADQQLLDLGERGRPVR